MTAERGAAASHAAAFDVATGIEARRTPPPALPEQPLAVLVIHGMGEQIPFETLDTVANGLRDEEARRYGTTGPPPVARSVQLGSQRLQRIELSLQTGQGRRAVHVYEAYWAPFTEGQVSLRDVVAFLVRAGLHGVGNASGVFRRWMFGRVESFPIPVRTLVFLLAALLVVAGLAVINAIVPAALLAVAPARLAATEGAGRAAGWLGAPIVGELTRFTRPLLGAVEAFAVVLAVSWAAGSCLPRWRAVRLLLALASAILFVVVIFLVVITATALPLVALARGAGFQPAAVPFGLAWRAAWAPTLAAWGVVAAVAGGILWLAIAVLVRFVRGAVEDTWAGRAFSALVIALFGLLIKRLVAVVLMLLPPGVGAAGGVPSDPLCAWLASPLPAGAAAAGCAWIASPPPLFVWALLAGVSLVARRFLIQYVGDVAAYVQPHTLDRFYDLRKRIKDTVRNTAHAIYAARGDGARLDYAGVALVGHSLGSVIAYDTLNRLLDDDATAPATALDVLGRTRLLLTFGSPLDKTAFIFSTQHTRLGTDAREALAGAVQPLIAAEATRALPWVNVFSPWDLISGELGFYDRPQARPGRVLNERDPDALTFLAAHAEYWRNRLVWERLYDGIG
ncbi:MAG: hypothetical protein HYR86_01385 [Candidatus Rokubacteria bacterium]|nr:hypothetical protein [Candidatus Rokubacteria bacterium]